MKESRRRHGLVALGVAIAAWLGFGAYYLWTAPGGLKNLMLGASAPASTPAIGGYFSLTDQNGQVVKDSTFRGQMMLVFFGYTHCPDVCPTTMQAVGDAIDSLGQKGELVRPVFITVDPERDTVARMREFAENFHPRLAALTGSPEEIAQAAKAYRVYYRKAPPQPGQGADDYLMDHSSFLFLMGTDGRYLTHFSGNATAEEIAEGAKKYL